MQAEREIWGWRDSRTGARVSVSTTLTKEQADRELAGWRRRDERGGRPDLHDSMPFIEVFRIWPLVPGEPDSSVYPPKENNSEV